MFMIRSYHAAGPKTTTRCAAGLNGMSLSNKLDAALFLGGAWMAGTSPLLSGLDLLD
jgi:hypothetical protein